jgi:hypothetical protein
LQSCVFLYTFDEKAFLTFLSVFWNAFDGKGRPFTVILDGTASDNPGQTELAFGVSRWLLRI